jgi:transposase
MMGTILGTELRPGNRKGRPNYPVEFKRRLAAAACEAGVSVSKLAMANAVNANMVFKWRRELHAGLFDDAPAAVTKLLPVVLAATPVEVGSDAATAPTSRSPGTAVSMIEIVIADAVVRVHGSADAAMLATIFQSLRA